jgi:hypothetical protein
VYNISKPKPTREEHGARKKLAGYKRSSLFTPSSAKKIKVLIKMTPSKGFLENWRVRTLKSATTLTIMTPNITTLGTVTYYISALTIKALRLMA